MDQWLPAIESTIRESTFTGYRCHVRHHIIPRIGDLQLDRIEGGNLNALYAELLARGRSDAKGGALRPTTVKRVHATLHRAFRDAVRWGLIDANPADAADPPRRGDSPEMTTWSASQLAAFLESVADHELFPLWVLLATTGVRRGEAIGVRWSDVDLTRRSIAIRQTIIAIGSRIVISPPKSSRSRRVIALDDVTVKVLRAHKRGQEKKTTIGRQTLVFSHLDGSPLDPTRVTKTFQKLAAEAGMPRIRLHDLRHTHATIALQAGIHPKIVSERLGHSTVSLTLDVYSHAIPHMQKDAARKIASLVFGPNRRSGNAY